MRKLKLKKGDNVIVSIIKGSDRARGIDMSFNNIEDWIYPGEVLSATNRYINVMIKQLDKVEKFDIELDYKQKVTRGSSNYKLYTSINEIADEEKSKMITEYLQKVFNPYSGVHLSLGALEKIKDIVDKELK